MKVIKFPSIKQYREIVTKVVKHYTFVGLDENEDSIYDDNLPKPTLTFKGTVKLHGTNASVAYNETDGMWTQSRTDIISIGHDNAGFASFHHSKKEIFQEFFNTIKTKYNIDTKENSIVIYGEWAGKGIQKGVGINNLPKSFFIFGVKIRPHNEEIPSYWLDHDYLRSGDDNIFNINDYETYSITIDFNKPEESQELLLSITDKVEEECPVSKSFGFSGIGEGVVWSTIDNGHSYRFKVKGEKHSKVKTKVIREVDDIEEQKKLSVAEKVTPSWRLDQGLTETFNLLNGGVLERSGIGRYIKWIINDVIKEDMDIIIGNGFEIKQVSGYISEIARDYYFEQEKFK